MAGASNPPSALSELGRKILDELKCGLCLQTFDFDVHAPKVYQPCLHTLCKSCLDEVINRCIGRYLSCFMCRARIRIPDASESDSEFSTNREIQNILTIVYEADREITPPRFLKCNLHEGKVISMLCVTCDVGICINCVIKSQTHTGHEIEMMEEAVTGCSEEADNEVKDIKEILTTVQNSIREKEESHDADCLKLLHKLKAHKTKTKALFKRKKSDLNQPDNVTVEEEDKDDDKKQDVKEDKVDKLEPRRKRFTASNLAFYMYQLLHYLFALFCFAFIFIGYPAMKDGEEDSDVF